jgi:hypothetical protein
MTDYKRLSQEERIAARNRAIDAVVATAGPAPSREHFKHSQQSEYPAWLRGLIVALSLVVLLTAFILSAMRLYHIGRETFAVSINHGLSATVAGAAIVLLAEAAAVLFTLAYSVLGKSPLEKRILMASIIGTAALALSGNFYVALWGHHLTGFVILEAMLPPLLTLSTAYVLKSLLLDEIAARHADELAYQSALVIWRAAASNPESHPQYLQYYANELWDSLVKANARREAAKAWLLSLGGQQKSLLVGEAMRADSWLDQDALLTLPRGDTQEYEVVGESSTGSFLATQAGGR